MRGLALVLPLLVPLLAAGGTPAEGVALTVRRGFFTETDFGGFMTFGGESDDGARYSNLQPYLQLGVGYDVSQTIELGLHFGIGSNAQSCWSGLDLKGGCIETDNFTLAFLDVTAAYLVQLAERFYVTPKLALGYTRLEPAPLYDPPRTADKKLQDGARPLDGGPNAGVGVGLEYATSMDHFSIGLDVLGRYVIGLNKLTLQFFPRVKYTF